MTRLLLQLPKPKMNTSLTCKGQIIIHTSETDGSEPEHEIPDVKKDPRLVWPFSLLLCDPTRCGKLHGS